MRTHWELDSNYVEKTLHIRDLIDRGDYYFLSRPRRVGKSLLVDALKPLFERNEEIFRELENHGHWDRSIRHPVVRLSFDGKYNKPGDIERIVLNQLVWIEEEQQLDLLVLPEPGQNG